jgi:hypothetical protein
MLIFTELDIKFKVVQIKSQWNFYESKKSDSKVHMGEKCMRIANDSLKEKSQVRTYNTRHQKDYYT